MTWALTDDQEIINLDLAGKIVVKTKELFVSVHTDDDLLWTFPLDTDVTVLAQAIFTAIVRLPIDSWSGIDKIDIKGIMKDIIRRAEAAKAT